MLTFSQLNAKIDNIINLVTGLLDDFTEIDCNFQIMSENYDVLCSLNEQLIKENIELKEQIKKMKEGSINV